jgi:uncharacterized membrane protein
MELNKNSFSAKLYKYFYGKHSILPNNLCQYFWALFIAYLLVIPFSILIMPYLLFNKILKKRERVTISIVLYLAVLVLICIVVFVYGCFNSFCFIRGNSNPLMTLLSIGGFTSLFVLSLAFLITGFIFLRDHMQEKINNKIKKKNKIKKPNIIKERWKNFKEKTCTTIMWKN